MRTTVAPGEGVVGTFADGQHFDRAEGETEDVLRARARMALGWSLESEAGNG